MDSAELGELYARHMPAARAFAFLLTAGDSAFAEDLAQDAFLRAASRWGVLRDPASFEAYLRRAVANAVTSWFRRRRLERRWQQTQLVEDEQAADSSRIESLDTVSLLLRRLPPRQRLAVAARICLDLSESQTAELMGCSVGAVKAYTSRGLQSLRAVVEHDVKEGTHDGR